MEILIYEPTNRIQKLVANAVIGMGFRPKTLGYYNDIIPTLMEKNYDLLLMECNSHKLELMEIIKDIKLSSQKISSQKIFLHTIIREKDFIFEMLKSGISGIIYKPFRFNSFKKQFLASLEQSKMQPRQRKHIRIRPVPEEKAILTFRNPVTMKIVNGKILDISLGGVAIQTDNALHLQHIEVRQTIHHAKISINPMRLHSSLSVVVLKGNFIAFKYLIISNFDLTNLCDYIYRYLNSGFFSNYVRASPGNNSNDALASQ